MTKRPQLYTTHFSDGIMEDTMRIPKIIYGTAWKKERTADLVYTAIRVGFRAIDTACQPKHYKEDLVGEGIKRAIDEGIVTRQDLYIQTKFTSIDGQDRTQPLPYDPRQPIASQVQSSLSRSLQNLQTNYLDSVILHSPLRTRAQTLEAWKVLQKAVEDGKVKRIGVSNDYDVEEVKWLCDAHGGGAGVAVIQNRWYEGNGWDWEVYDLCQKKGIIYQSFWTLTGSPTLLAHRTLVSLAHRLNVTPEATLYRICQLWGITPLCGSTTLKHVQEALEAEKIQLSKDDEDVKKLWKLMRGES